jgi:hypothetical protein
MLEKEVTFKKIIGEQILDKLYPKVENRVDIFAKAYLDEHSSVEDACRDMISNQKKKCAASGFVTNLGGVITLPIAVPANVASVLYMQLQMIACIAYMAGYDVKSDKVRTCAFICLVGISVNKLLKEAGVKMANKVAMRLVKKIPVEIIRAINRAIGFRLITKAGEKGIINLNKCVPVVGGFVGAGLDYFETEKIASRAYECFFLKQGEVYNHFLESQEDTMGTVSEDTDGME